MSASILSTNCPTDQILIIEFFVLDTAIRFNELCLDFIMFDEKSSIQEKSSKYQPPHNVFDVDDYVPDIVIFALGTNDGTPNDTYDSAMEKTVLKSDGYSIDVDATLANLDETKFCESARKAYLRIKSAFPMAQIYVVLPIQRSYDEGVFGNLHTYLKQMAERYGAITIDGAGNSGITRDFNVRENLGLYLKDGLHPNEKGQNLLARLIISSLKANYMSFGYGFNQ